MLAQQGVCVYILEQYEQWWTFQLSVLLVTIYREVKRAKAEGKTQLSSQELDTTWQSSLEVDLCSPENTRY